MVLQRKLLDTEKQKLIDLTKSNIEKAGGDRALGIKNTQDYLKGISTTGGSNLLQDSAKAYNATSNYSTSNPITENQKQELATTGDYLKTGTTGGFINFNKNVSSMGTNIGDITGTSGTSGTTGGTTTTGSTGTSGSTDTGKQKSSLELAQEEIARQKAEYEKLNNQGAQNQLEAGVIPTFGGLPQDQTDYFKNTTDFLQNNLKTEIDNLTKQQEELNKSIQGGGLTTEEQKAVLDPYNQFLDKVTNLKNLNEQQLKTEQTALTQRYADTISRQTKANELALINAQKIAAITGSGFTSGGVQGINNIIEESQQSIKNLEADRENMLSKYKTEDAKLDIEYLDTITTIQKESKQALQDRYNSVITQIQKIDAEKGKATKEGLLAIKDVAKEYFDALNAQWDKDYKIMDFNYKKLVDYKKELREDEAITREQQKEQIDLIKNGDLTGMTDEDIMKLGEDMDLDTGTIQGLILTREQQKRKNALEGQKTSLEERKFALEQQKANQKKSTTGGVAGTGNITQNYGATSPNSKDNVLLANGQIGTPGVDYKMPENSIINTGIDGEVISAGNKGDYGNQVVIKDSEGNLHMYSHLNRINVKVGDKITSGTNIALSGNTGFSTGPHLDYRVKSANGQWQDPNNYNGIQSNLSDDITTKTINIGRLAYGTTISDTESERIQGLISKYPNKSVQDIALAVRGFDIKDPKNNDIALQYLNTFNTLAKPPAGFESNISRYLNKGDTVGLKNYAMKFIDDEVKKSVPSDEYISSSSYKTQSDNVYQLINLIERNKGLIGPVAGTSSNWISKLKNSPDFTKIKSLLQMTQADARKKFAGSAVTETEMKALENFIGGTEKMNPDNLITQLKTLNDKTKREYLNQRNFYPITPTTYNVSGGSTTKPTGKTDIKSRITELRKKNNS